MHERSSNTATLSAAPGDLPATDHLPDDPALLKRMILELLATLQETRQEREELHERLQRLLQRLYGRRNERFDPNQPWLFADLQQPVATETPAADTPAAEEEATPNSTIGPLPFSSSTTSNTSTPAPAAASKPSRSWSRRTDRSHPWARALRAPACWRT